MPDHTRPVIIESLGLLNKAAVAVTDGNGSDRTPCTEWTVIQVLQHAVGDQLAWAAALGVGPGPSDNPFTPSGVLQGSVQDLTEPAISIALQAWSTVRSGDEAVPTPLPQGALPADTAAAACALDAAVHAWDIAVALGQPAPLTESLAALLLPTAHAVVEPLRQYGAYAPALPPAPRDDLVEGLLRYLGRHPAWPAGRA